MADNDSGARRPPPPPPRGQTGERRAVTPPPTPALRDRTPPPAVAQPASSGPLSLPAAKKNFSDITGERFYSNFRKILNMLCASCGFTIKGDFSIRANELLLFRGQEVAKFENGAMEIPLDKLGNEVEVYGRLYPQINSGEIPAPSFARLSSIPHGMFLRISDSGIELCFRAAEEAAAPQSPVADQRMLLAVRKLLRKMGEIDLPLSKAISVNGNSVFFRKGVDLVEIARIPEPGGEFRLYVTDIGWAAPQCKALLGACGASVSEDRLIFFFMNMQVYLCITENGFALCNSKDRGSGSSTYHFFNIK